jgi:hypothetical protein
VFDVLTELEDAIDKVAADESAVDGERLCRLADRVEFLRLRAIGSFDRSGEWRLNDSLTAAAALRMTCRMNSGHAVRAVELARKLDDLPELAEAFAAGDVSRAHVEVIADGYTPERAEMLRGIEHELVDYARLATPRELRAAVRRATDAFDGDGGAAADEVEHAKNRVSLPVVAGRGVLTGDLDAESTEIVASALDAQIEALANPDDHDRRPIAERRADALVAICRRSLASHPHDTGPRRGLPHVSVVADIGALTGTTDDLLAELRSEAAHVGLLSQATHVRLQDQPHPHRRGEPGPRCRPRDPHRQHRTMESPRRSRPALHPPRLHPPTRLLRRPPHHPLDPRRTHRPRQPQTPLLGTPPKRAPAGRNPARMRCRFCRSRPS